MNYFKTDEDEKVINSKPLNIEKTYGKKVAKKIRKTTLSNSFGVKLKSK